jgi:hypothetical protein
MTNLPRNWKPLVKVPRPKFGAVPEAAIVEFMKVRNCARDESIRLLYEYALTAEHWISDRYLVQLRQQDHLWCHIGIEARNGGVILRDWRHFQAIKNQLVGEECEAVELYPAESRLMDLCNKYHLWCCKDPTFRVPFGPTEREVNYNNDKQPGLRQRSF